MADAAVVEGAVTYTTLQTIQIILVVFGSLPTSIPLSSFLPLRLRNAGAFFGDSIEILFCFGLEFFDLRFLHLYNLPHILHLLLKVHIPVSQ